MTKMKVAFSGSSGSGKTTLVKFVSEALDLKHISGSSGDILTPEDKENLRRILGKNTNGHLEVIINSALNHQYGATNQMLLQQNREKIIYHNNHFVTDRSPVDNFTYMISQVGFHPEVDNDFVEWFRDRCLRAWGHLTHVIYVKAMQPGDIENNGSRIANNYWQKASDAQFDYWFNTIFKLAPKRPEILVIDYWDLEKRKEAVVKFLTQ